MTESTKIDYVSIVQDLRDEADLCRNETATDIADLLDDAASCIVAMKSQFVALRADLAAAQEWKERVLDELIVAHIYTKEHDTNPKKAIHDAIVWNCQVAIDPAVSSDARKLIAQERERCAKVCDEVAGRDDTDWYGPSEAAAAIRRGDEAR